jgi:hypothetical protein
MTGSDCDLMEELYWNLPEESVGKQETLQEGFSSMKLVS